MGKEKKPRKVGKKTDIKENGGKVLINLRPFNVRDAVFGERIAGWSAAVYNNDCRYYRSGNINRNRSFRFRQRTENNGGIAYVDNMVNAGYLNSHIWGNAVGLVA
jgi:hypothetical protein